MIDSYIRITRILRLVSTRIIDVCDPRIEDNKPVIVAYLKGDLRELDFIWPKALSKDSLLRLWRCVEKGTDRTFTEALEKGMPAVEDSIDKFYLSQPYGELKNEIADFLHPVVLKCSYAQFRNGYYRDAVLNGVIGLFDLIRSKSGVSLDGIDLVNQVFSLQRPKLVVPQYSTESGKNEQKGLMLMLQGVFTAARNPGAHTLAVAHDEVSAARLLVFASYLADLVEKCITPELEAKQLNDNTK